MEAHGLLSQGDIVERYVVEDVIGVGGMATVYSVKHRVLGSRHALKVLRNVTDELATSFINEGRIQARLDPEYVIPVTDVLVVDDAPALIMPLVLGCSLSDVLGLYQPTQVEVGALLHAIAAGIASAHRIGVIHRDLKPSNVLLDVKHGRVRARVADFGLARQPDDMQASPDLFMGTPEFAAPEQFTSPHAVDLRTDVWALGAVLVRLLTGNPPFGRGTPRDVYLRMQASPFDVNQLPNEWRELAGGMLQRDPRRRFSDIEWIIEQIQQIIHSTEIHIGSPLVDAIERARLALENDAHSLLTMEQTRYEKGALGSADSDVIDASPGTIYDLHLSTEIGDTGNDISSPGLTMSELPVARDTFIGRTTELETLQAMFLKHPRLVTVLGMGGTGKTRFALQYAKVYQEYWPGGVVFCDLTDARTVEDVCTCVANAFGVPLVSIDHVEQLGHALAARDRTLIILDNFEQIVQMGPDTVERWLQDSAASTFLVTSRIILSIPGEQTFPLLPLGETESTELYIDRARKVRPTYAPDDDEMQRIDKLVTVLDRLPLAIELAAARCRVLSTQKILQRVNDRFRLLASKEFKSKRQATLRGAIDWSWDLLSESERSMFAQVSVFEGGFDLEALEQVVSFQELNDPPWPVDTVQALVEKSLVRTVGDDRFDLLVSVRDYAREKLEDTGHASAVRNRHSKYFSSFGTEEAVEAMNRHGGVHVSDRAILEFDNLKAALHNATVAEDTAVAICCFRALSTVIERRGPYMQSVELSNRVLAVSSLTRLQRGQVQAIQGQVDRLAGERERAIVCLEEAAEIGHELSDATLEVLALRNLVFGLYWVDQQDAAEQVWQRAVRLARSHELHNELAMCLIERSDFEYGLGNDEQGLALLEEGMAIARELGNDRATVLALTISSYWKPDVAVSLLEEALHLADAWRDTRAKTSVFPALAYSHLRDGEVEVAKRQYVRALKLASNIGALMRKAMTLTCLAEVSLMLGEVINAQSYAQQGVESGARSWNLLEGVSRGVLALLAAYDGRHNEANFLLPRAEALVQPAGSKSETAKLQTAKAHIYYLVGKTDEAQRIFADVESQLEDFKILEPYQQWLLKGYHALTEGKPLVGMVGKGDAP